MLAAAVTLAWRLAPVSLSGSLVDAVTADAVYHAEIEVQGRLYQTFYSGDFRFTGLRPGRAQLRIAAPGYPLASTELTLRRGTNRQAPIHLVAQGIPGLAAVFVFPRSHSSGDVLEVRLADSEGKGIVHPPGVPMRLLVRIHSQTGSGNDAAPDHSEVLYEGALPVYWDREKFFGHRYYAPFPTLPGTIEKDEALYVQCLLLVATRGALDQGVLDSLAERLLASRGETEIRALLEQSREIVVALVDRITDLPGEQYRE